jgi:hypothetical protein
VAMVFSARCVLAMLLGIRTRLGSVRAKGDFQYQIEASFWREDIVHKVVEDRAARCSIGRTLDAAALVYI